MRKDVTIERSLCSTRWPRSVVVIDESYELTREKCRSDARDPGGPAGSPPCESRAEVSAVDELSHTERGSCGNLPSNLSRSHIARELYVSVNT